MPDISNEDLMKLVYRVIKKVDTLEEKLERVLEKQDEVLFYLVGNRTRKPSKSKFRVDEDEDFEELDYAFKFSPIVNDAELDHVSQKIDQDERYRRNLVSYRQGLFDTDMKFLIFLNPRKFSDFLCKPRKI